MRSAKRAKSNKKSSRHERISKKRYKNTSRGKFCWNDNLSKRYIDDINEAIRLNKSRRSDGKGSWKLVPKDSCEVYKDRKKRLATNKKSDPNSEEISMDTESEMEEDKTDNKKKLRKKYTKKTIRSKNSQSKKQRKKRDYKSRNIEVPRKLIHSHLFRGGLEESLNRPSKLVFKVERLRKF